MTGSTIAYGLRADHEPDGPEPFLGGLIRVGPDRDLDVAASLEQGNGRIVVAAEDHMAVNALDAYPPLKRLSADDGDELTVRRWADVNVPELRDELASRNLPTAGLKADLVNRLEDHDAAILAGPDAVAHFMTLPGGGAPIDDQAGTVGDTDGTTPEA